MAEFGRKARKDSKAQDTVSESEVTSEVNGAPESAEDFDSLMASFDSESEGETEMAKQDTQNVVDAEVVNDSASEDTTESAVSDAAKEIANRATGHTVEMLEISSLPPTVPHITMALSGLQPIVDLITAATKEWEANTSGSDAKIKNEIATLTEESDPEGFKLREAIIAAKAQIAELEEMIERDEPKLYASVEDRLAKAGDVMWSEETKAEKRQYISDMYGAYLSQHKAAEQFIETHKAHKSKDADKVGTIDQYHTKLDKPFKRVGSSGGTGVRKSSGAPRNVSVSDARISYDGGLTWNKAEGRLKEDGPLLSNPSFLSAEIARNSKETGNDIKARLYSEWYGDNGSADGTPVDSDSVKDVSEFDFTFIGKDGESKSAKVRITKKGATVEV